ncbi:MAG: hypothetical protein UF067_03465, partial [Paludibacteraceae bacterium]|nr:hypothetical protein [Paludibacteraceae bacterium]
MKKLLLSLRSVPSLQAERKQNAKPEIRNERTVQKRQKNKSRKTLINQSFGFPTYISVFVH